MFLAFERLIIMTRNGDILVEMKEGKQKWKWKREMVVTTEAFFNELVEEFLSCHNYTLSLTDELD